MSVCVICDHDRKRNQCKQCGGASICEHNRHRRRKESPEKSEDEDLEEDEEFYDQVQHAVQVMTVRRAPQTKAKVSVSTD